MLFSIILDCNPDVRYPNAEINKDIDMAEPSEGNNSKWKIDYRPLGTAPNPYEGKIKGNKKTIKNLTINNAHNLRVGLTGCMINGQILELTLENCDILEKSYVGAFSGFMQSGQIADCHVVKNDSNTGPNVKGILDCIGGIAGAVAEKSTISKCTTEGNVQIEGNNVVGGIVGEIYFSTVYEKGDDKCTYKL